VDTDPLQPGGFIVIQGYALGLAPASRLEYEVEHNIDILLLVIFMVACVHFLKNLLLWIFTNLLIKIESKVLLSVGILLASAIMSAFMDALSVSAVLISVCSGVLGAYSSQDIRHQKPFSGRPVFGSIADVNICTRFVL